MTIRRILIAAAIAAVLFGVASLPVLADYLGPDRTTVAIVTVRATDRDVWTLTNPKSPPGTPPVCLIIHTCDEHPGIDRQRDLCGWVAENSGCDEAYIEEERVVELPQATSAASLIGCTLSNGWCLTPSQLRLTGSEPLDGETILALEGTLNGEFFFCDGDQCDLPLQEGISNLEFWALSSYGDNSLKRTLTARVDTVPPHVAFETTGLAAASGVVALTGRGGDATSGLASVELSLDGGASWASLAFDPDGAWRFDWDVSGLPEEGVYPVLARARDQAGHTGQARTSVYLDRTPPWVELPDAWPIWQDVLLRVGDEESGLARVRVTIDGGEYGLRRYDYGSPQQWLPDAIAWDRRFGEILAPIGDYRITVEAWDRAGNRGAARGEIQIPAPVAGQPEPINESPIPPPLLQLGLDEAGQPVAPISEPLASVPEPVSPPVADPEPVELSGPADLPQQPGNSSVLWGMAAVAASGAVTAQLMRRRQARAAALARARARAAASRSPESFQARLRRLGQRAYERIRPVREAFLRQWNRAEATRRAEEAAMQRQEAALRRAEEMLRAEEQASGGSAQPGGAAPPVEATPEQQEASEREQAYQHFMALDRSTQVTPAAPPAAPASGRSWWQRAVDDVQQAANDVVNWVDAHQAEVALGVGVVAGVTAIVVSGGTATPLVVAGWAALGAGTAAAAGTVALNAHFGRSLTDNLVRNVAYSVGASMVPVAAHWLLTGGASGLLLGAGQAVAGVCLRQPALCARVEPVLHAMDTIEQAALSVQLAFQTATKDPRAGQTAIELQLETMDGGLPGNTAIRRVKELGGDTLESLAAHGDEAVDLAATLARHSDEVVEVLDRGMLRVAPDAAASVADDLRATLNTPGRVAARGGIEVNVWHSAPSGAVYASLPTQQALDALDELETIVASGRTTGADVDRLVDTVAAASTRGSGNRVVLGKFGDAGEYIQEALDRGGIFYDTSDEVWSRIKKLEQQGIDSIRFNEAFLRQQMEVGTGRIELTNETIEEVFQRRGTSATAAELDYMEVWGARFGYVLEGNTWVLKNP